jgi:hypothetical protein
MVAIFGYKYTPATLVGRFFRHCFAHSFNLGFSEFFEWDGKRKPTVPRDLRFAIDFWWRSWQNADEARRQIGDDCANGHKLVSRIRECY